MTKSFNNLEEAEDFFQRIKDEKKLLKRAIGVDPSIIYLGYAERQLLLLHPKVFLENVEGYNPKDGLVGQDMRVCGLELIFVYKKSYLAVGY